MRFFFNLIDVKGFLKSFKPLLSFFKKRKLEVIFLAIALITSIVSFFIFVNVNVNQITDEENINEQTIITPKKIYVDLSGAVLKPDIYEITNGTRLKNIIIKAGGLTEKADKDFFSRNFNQARILSDQEKIYIPSVSEISTGLFIENQQIINNPLISIEAPEPSILIDINFASVEELDTLPGIGKVTANKIIQARPFTVIEDLLTKKVVNKSVWEKIKNLITIE